MYKSVKARWLSALRSGEYRQTTGNLRDEDGFCCLGVLCDLFRREQRTRRWGHSTHGNSFLGEVNILPRTVAEWAGLADTNPILGLDSAETATYLNDSGIGFDRIADYIEANL